jgi:hypothetical protein
MDGISTGRCQALICHVPHKRLGDVDVQVEHDCVFDACRGCKALEQSILLVVVVVVVDTALSFTM